MVWRVPLWLSQTGEAISRSVQDPQCLIGSVWCWRPGRVQERCWSSVYTGIAKKLILKSVKEILILKIPSGKRDELARESEDKQLKEQIFFLHVFLSRRCCPYLGWIFLLHNLIKKNPLRNALQIMSQLLLDAVNLTTKIIHHSSLN